MIRFIEVTHMKAGAPGVEILINIDHIVDIAPSTSEGVGCDIGLIYLGEGMVRQAPVKESYVEIYSLLQRAAL